MPRSPSDVAPAPRRARAAALRSSSQAKTYVGSAARRRDGAAVLEVVGVMFVERMSGELRGRRLSAGPRRSIRAPRAGALEADRFMMASASCELLDFGPRLPVGPSPQPSSALNRNEGTDLECADALSR